MSCVGRGSLGAFALLLGGCGGGLPLLHPARTLPAGDVSVTAGALASVPLGSAASDLNAARSQAATNPNAPGTPGSDPTYAKGALVAAVIAPGVAPVVAARVGIGARAEGGITYTGRAARIDLRRSFDFGDYSVSLGAGLTAAFYGSTQSSELPNVDLRSLHGYGADVPVLFGWRSTADLYMVWVGVRAGWEHDTISTLTTEPLPALPGEPIGLSATRFYGGGLAGLAAGFRHVHVALEIEVAYQTIHGFYNSTEATVSGLSAAPAGAVWVTF